MNRGYRRRDVLAGAVAGATVLAGCSGNDDGDAGGDGGDDGTNANDDENDETTVKSNGGNTDTEQQTATTTEQDGDAAYNGEYFEITSFEQNTVEFHIHGWPDAWNGGVFKGGDRTGIHPEDNKNENGDFVITVHDDPVRPDQSTGHRRVPGSIVSPGLHLDNRKLAYLSDTGLFGEQPQISMIALQEDAYETVSTGTIDEDELHRIDNPAVTAARINPDQYIPDEWSDHTGGSELGDFTAAIYHPSGSPEAGSDYPTINIFFQNSQ